MKNSNVLVRCGQISVLAAALLCVVPASSAPLQEKSFAEMVKKFALVPEGASDSDMLAKTTAAVRFIEHMELPAASHALNEALQMAPRNSYLHFLNGFVYQLQAKQGDTQKNELAIEGYQEALRIDPGNWIAREFLGLAYLDYKRFAEAKAQFSEVLRMTPDSSVSTYGLMVSAYLTGDAATACAMADQYQHVEPAMDADAVRSSASVYASCGQFGKAEAMRNVLATRGSQVALARVDRRLAQWKSFHGRQDAPVFANTSLESLSPVPTMQLAQAFTLPSIHAPVQLPAQEQVVEAAPAARPATAAPAAAPATGAAGGAPDGPRMVLVDVVLISAQEMAATSKGINLFNALTIQLGSVAGNLGAFSRVDSSNSVNDAAASVTTAITRAVTVPALSYSLNIANANSSVNEVLARPTLAAIDGMPSEFFSGTNLSAGVVSTSGQGGTTVVPLDKRFGIKLGVTPTFLSNGRVQLKVDAQRTSLLSNASNARVAYQVELGEITANANVVMNLGDTLVLSGLSEKVAATTRDGVPILQDIPFMQYLFSNKQTNDVQRSVLILITPRAPAYTGSHATNTDAVLRHLDTNALYREFRQSDVALERWDRMDSTGFRLRQALEFLYY